MPSKILAGMGSWTLLNKVENRIKQKIESVGKPLASWDLQINYGIKTGFNKAFIIDAEKRKELQKKCPKADEIIRPILLGKNIKRYNYQWEDKWIIFTRRGINIDEYPSIKDYLWAFYEDLKPRNNGELKGRKPGNYKWYEIQDNVAYYNDFDNAKIAWGNLALRGQFSLIDKGFYINAPSAFITTDNLYLLAVLNSRIADFYIKHLGVTRNGGYFEYKPMFIEQLPIPKVSETKQSEFNTIVRKLLLTSPNEREQIENKIEEMVSDVYGLSHQELQAL